MNNVLNTRANYNLDNYYQRAEAAGLFLIIADRAHQGCIAGAWFGAEYPHNWIPELDGRTVEMKEFRAAESELTKAMVRYDKARIEALKKAKEKRNGTKR